MRKIETSRNQIPVITPDPALGLTAAQAEERTAGGWAAGTPAPSGKSTREIIFAHCFTFFNAIFLLLSVLLILAGSSWLNMGFLVIAVINTVIGIGIISIMTILF